jgi:hypothetical protein
LIRGAAVYGCELPLTESFAVVLSDQINELLNGYGYGELTLEEIFLAMHLNVAHNLKNPKWDADGTEKITFSGRFMNSSFLSKVLHRYMIIRNTMDGVISNNLEQFGE